MDSYFTRYIKGKIFQREVDYATLLYKNKKPKKRIYMYLPDIYRLFINIGKELVVLAVSRENWEDGKNTFYIFYLVNIQPTQEKVKIG